MRLVDLRLNQLPELLGAIVQTMHDLGFYVRNKNEIPINFVDDIQEQIPLS